MVVKYFVGHYRSYRLLMCRNLIEKNKLVKISGGKCVAADVSTAAAAIIKTNDARGVAVTSA